MPRRSKGERPIFAKPSRDSLLWPRSARIATASAIGLWALIALVPIGLIAVELFRDGKGFTLENLRVALLDGRQWILLRNSLGISLGAASLAVLLGSPFAFLVARTDLPLRAVFAALGTLPILLPPLIAGIAWNGLAGAKGPIWTATIFGCSYSPFVWLLLARAMERVDRRQEEAACIAGGWRAALRAEIPLLVPSAAIGALLVFLFTIADFALPDYLSSVGPKFNVYADDVFFRWKQLGSSGEAIASSLPPVLLLAAALIAIFWLRRRAAPFMESGFQPAQRLRLGSWRWAALCFGAAFLLAVFLLPVARLAWEAGAPDSYLAALREAKRDLGNSILLAAGAAALASSIQILPALLGASRGRGRASFDFFAALPLALPALLLAIGLIRLWNRNGPLIDWSEWIYGSKAVVAIAFVARFSAFSHFATGEAARGVSPFLEEAGALAGIPWWARLRRILFPLLLPAWITGAGLVFLFSMREIDSVALLPSGNPTVLFRIYNYIHFGRDSLIAALCLVTILAIAIPLLALALWKDAREESP